MTYLIAEKITNLNKQKLIKNKIAKIVNTKISAKKREKNPELYQTIDTVTEGLDKVTKIAQATAVHAIKSDNIPAEIFDKILDTSQTIKERLGSVSSKRALNSQELFGNVVHNSLKPIKNTVENYEKSAETINSNKGLALVSSLALGSILDGGITFATVAGSTAIVGAVAGLTQGVGQAGLSAVSGIHHLNETINEPQEIKAAKKIIQESVTQDDFFNPKENNFLNAVDVLVNSANAKIIPLIHKIQETDKVIDEFEDKKETTQVIYENQGNITEVSINEGKEEKKNNKFNKIKKYSYLALQYNYFKQIARTSKPLEVLENTGVISRADNGLYVNNLR